MTAPIPPGYPQPEPARARSPRLSFFGARRRAADLAAEVARLQAELDRKDAFPAQVATIEHVECSLLPEPWNEHDPNAVAVMIGPHHVGYIPAELAVDYAGPLGRCVGRGCRVTGIARIWAKDDGGMIRARVTVLVPSPYAIH